MELVFRARLNSPEQTYEAARALAEVVEPGVNIGLVGDLGAGKTMFVKGLAKGLGVANDALVTSPTFTLVNEYSGARAKLIHADLYRIERDIDLDEIGLREVCATGEVIAAVEWYDRFPDVLVDPLHVELSVDSESTRLLSVSAGTPRERELASAWRSCLSPSRQLVDHR